jgi:hypothetical protein
MYEEAGIFGPIHFFAHHGWLRICAGNLAIDSNDSAVIIDGPVRFG